MYVPSCSLEGAMAGGAVALGEWWSLTVSAPAEQANGRREGLNLRLLTVDVARKHAGQGQQLVSDVMYLCECTCVKHLSLRHIVSQAACSHLSSSPPCSCLVPSSPLRSPFPWSAGLACCLPYSCAVLCPPDSLMWFRFIQIAAQAVHILWQLTHCNNS
jgi:hypothetical protein